MHTVTFLKLFEECGKYLDVLGFMPDFFPPENNQLVPPNHFIVTKVEERKSLHWHFQYVKSFEYISPLFKKKIINTTLKTFMFCENSGKILL